MKYRKFIEDWFLIDEPKTGQLVPFKFNRVQVKYYNELCTEYDIETKGLTIPLREDILKARREGFSSLILGLFAADDILNENPTESLVVSYKDDATATFRKRYRNFVLSYAARKAGYEIEEIRKNPQILDQVAKAFLSVDANDIEIAHNRAHFYCGTASARTGGRGGVLQKLLFSEAAHYPDTELMKAQEIVDGTMRQVDIASGWTFIESTANGKGNYYYEMWEKAVKGLSRFRPRFYGWREFYTEEEFKVIASEFINDTMRMQEYPETPEEAFIASGAAVFRLASIQACIDPKLRLVDAFDARYSYEFGIDLAQHVDWTVVCGINKQRFSLEVFDRYNQIDYNLQKARMEALLRRFSVPGRLPRTKMDATGGYEAIVQDLQNRGLNVEGVKLSQDVKAQLITNLALMIEQRKIKLPSKEVLPELHEELEIFGYEILPSGRVRYTAPENKHDDCVIALALAVWEIGSRLPQYTMEEEKKLKKPFIFK